MRTETWVVLMVINALPADREQLRADLPKTASVFYADEPGMQPRTGIGMRLRTKTATRAISIALHSTVDLQVNLGHVPVSALEIYTEDDFRDRVLNLAANASFCAALFGPRAAGDHLAGELADTDLASVFEER